MINKNYILALSLLLTACASNQWESSNVEESFVTDIKSSGLKLFEYGLTRGSAKADGDGNYGGSNSKGSDKGSGKGKGKGGGKGGGKSVDISEVKLYLDKMLTLKLKSSGYCRDGYIEFNSIYGRRKLKIRGECIEGATEKDRIKFN
jgi:hypothetical protein